MALSTEPNAPRSLFACVGASFGATAVQWRNVRLPARLPFPQSTEVVLNGAKHAASQAARAASQAARAASQAARAASQAARAASQAARAADLQEPEKHRGDRAPRRDQTQEGVERDDGRNYDVHVVVFAGDAAGKPSAHPRGTYVCGGGFADDYDPELDSRELAAASSIRAFLVQVDQRMTARGDAADDEWPRLGSQEFHAALDVARRALASCDALARHHGYFATESGVRFAGTFLFRVLQKSIPLSQHRCTTRYMPALEALLRGAADAGGCDDVVFEMMWAAICDHAGLPHKPAACSFRIPFARHGNQVHELI